MITGLYAGLLGLIFISLSIQVIGRRRAARVSLGDGGDADLQRRVRAQANFAEYVPITLVLMVLIDLQESPVWLLHGIGALLLLGRVTHAIGLSQITGSFRARVIGMALTFTSLGLASGACLAGYLGFLSPSVGPQ